jgi:hypothetical protein
LAVLEEVLRADHLQQMLEVEEAYPQLSVLEV